MWKVAAGICLILVLAGLGAVVYLLSDAIHKLDHIALHQPKEQSVAQLQTTWVDRNGISHTVTTNKTIDESDTQHAARHKAAVDAMLVVYPRA